MGPLKPLVTVITPTVPERYALLHEAVASVAAQNIERGTVGLDVIADDLLEGPAVLRNRAIDRAATEWLLFLDDDDTLYPTAIQRLLEEAEASGADVIIPFCDFDGPPLPAGYCNREFDHETLRQHGIFPITVLARRSAVLDCGAFGSERYEDWELWNRMADRGYRFHVVPEVLWTYRTSHTQRRTNGWRA